MLFDFLQFYISAYSTVNKLFAVVCTSYDNDNDIF